MLTRIIAISNYSLLSNTQCIVKITDGKLNVNSNNHLEIDRDVLKNERREWLAWWTYVTDSTEDFPKVIMNPSLLVDVGDGVIAFILQLFETVKINQYFWEIPNKKNQMHVFNNLSIKNFIGLSCIVNPFILNYPIKTCLTFSS